VKDAEFEFEKVFSKWWSGHLASKNKESTRKGGEGLKITSLDVIVADVEYISSIESPMSLVRVRRIVFRILRTWYVFNSMKKDISSLREKIFDAVVGRTVVPLQGTQGLKEIDY
jgi:hypothetical protein